MILTFYRCPAQLSFRGRMSRRDRFIGGSIHDPCCGGGNIVLALHAAGYRATGSDLVDRTGDGAIWFAGECDFLVDEGFGSVCDIVLNPPFFRAKGAEAFVRKALIVASGKVCAFVDIRFIAGAERAAGLFADHPPARIWIVTPRVSCPPGTYLAAGNPAGNGSSDGCRLIWDRTAPSSGTAIGWLKKAAA